MFRWFEKLLHTYPDGSPTPFPNKLLPFVWACTRGLRFYLIAMATFTAAIGIFEAFLLSVLGHLVDWLSTVTPTTLWRDHASMLLLFSAGLLLSSFLVVAQVLFKNQALVGNLPMRLRWKFHRLMLSQSVGFFQDEFAGRVTTKVMLTALAVRDLLMILTDVMIYIGIYFVSVAIVLSSFDIWILLPFCGWLLLYSIACCYFVPRLGLVSKQQADARSLMTGRFTDAYTNITTVKLFSHSSREADYARSAMHDFMQPTYQQQRLIAAFEIVNHTLCMALLLATVGTALWLWSRGQVGVGAVAAASAMALRFNGISHWAMWEMAALFEHIGTVQDGISLLSQRQSVVDAADAQPLQIKRGEIRFENVGFSYHHKKHAAVLDKFCLHISPGEKIGLVGRSGAGKSTLVNLLLRFYDIDSGQILIDGQNIAQVTQESLRRQIGMVTQDTSLLHRSVRDNIFYGRPDATDEMMLNAARRAEAHDFILGVSDAFGRTAYDAHVGERGVKLSGGQRQRIAIARVMLKDAPILLLDEATSALDSEAEAAIQTSLYRLMEGKTVVAIAHRLSTIAAMDRLIVLDQGQIVEEGTHLELLARNGIYAKLWAHQSGGFLGGNEFEA